MNKKLILLVMLVLLLAVVSGNLFAQSGPKNWIYGQVGLLGIGAGYERILMPKISVGAEGYWNNFFFFFNTSVFEAYGRYYFYKGIYGKLGLGFGLSTQKGAGWDKKTPGFAIDPGVGWKIDVGKTGGFYIEPKISIPIILGKETETIYYYGKEPDKKIDNGFKAKTAFVVAFAMGYAF